MAKVEAVAGVPRVAVADLRVAVAEEAAGPGGGAGGGFSASAMVDRMMSSYDTNGDGKIDKDEQAGLSDRARGMVETADSDGDGAVSKAEMTKAAEAMMQRFQGGGGGGPGGGGG